MDYKVICGETRGIVEALSVAITVATREAEHGHIILTIEQAKALLDNHDELLGELSEVAKHHQDVLDEEPCAAKNMKPVFFLLPGGVYLQPAAIAIVMKDQHGNAQIATVNNGIINIEALQWQLMQDDFREAIDLKVIKDAAH